MTIPQTRLPNVQFLFDLLQLLLRTDDNLMWNLSISFTALQTCYSKDYEELSFSSSTAMHYLPYAVHYLHNYYETAGLSTQ
jgi:hypothetical protein